MTPISQLAEDDLLNKTREPLNAKLQENKDLVDKEKIRLWPALILIITGILSLRVTSFYEDAPSWLWMVVAFGPLLCSILGLVWWTFFSRVTIRQRILGILSIMITGAMTLLLLDPSMLSPVIMMITFPLGMAGFVTGLYFSTWRPQQQNWLAFTGCLLGFGYSLFFRYEGMWGDFTVRLAPRWQPTSETLLLNRETYGQEVLSIEQRTLSVERVLWSGFRGNERRGIALTDNLETDWIKHPPEQHWRIKIGPGWSSYAVAGELLFTQEQRGENECVTCYDAASGNEIWIHMDQTRLDDPLGGPGPRATPTLHNGQLYTLGSTGILLCLNPVNGEVIWKVNIPEEVGRKVPMWGFCASPLLIGEHLIVHASERGDNDIFAYRASDGKLLWTCSAGEHSYSSPQKLNFENELYVAILTDEGLAILAPESGDILLNYAWPHSGYRALQPCFVGNRQIILPTGMGTGTRLIQINKEANNWDVREIWTTKNLKSDFNDLVVHHGHIYGFDDNIFTCIDLETGARNWKRGRYGKGQSLLLADDNLVMVLTEQGSMVVLDANSENHNELASMQMLNGKTWNHPVLIGDRLYLRNSEEAVCYVLPIKKAPLDLDHPDKNRH
tara:strand:+ start:3350 stop:5191 length:1842 start_codon:yes stop_codon:yes gene_type:complete